MKIAEKVNKESMSHFLKTLRYSLYLITHPFDAFWDLSREKRGSLAAANFMLVMSVLTYIWKLQYSSFIFYNVYWEDVNVFRLSLTILVPVFVGCLANWSLTTLFDGKGTLRDIYIAFGYALTPYVLLQLPMIVFSNFITVDEAAFYLFFQTFSMIWVAVLLFSAIMMVHDFTLGKTIIMVIATLFGMIVIMFLFFMFFSLITDGIAYFVSLYKEIAFRFY